jgi:hypothetical protein
MVPTTSPLFVFFFQNLSTISFIHGFNDISTVSVLHGINDQSTICFFFQQLTQFFSCMDSTIYPPFLSSMVSSIKPPFVFFFQLLTHHFFPPWFKQSILSGVRGVISCGPNATSRPGSKMTRKRYQAARSTESTIKTIETTV